MLGQKVITYLRDNPCIGDGNQVNNQPPDLRQDLPLHVLLYASPSFHCLGQPARHLSEDSHVVVTTNIPVNRMARRLEVWGNALEGEV